MSGAATVSPFPRKPVSEQTLKERIADLQAQIALIGTEQAEALTNAVADVLRCAEDVQANPSAGTGEREVARQVSLKVAPYLTTLRQMRARA